MFLQGTFYFINRYLYFFLGDLINSIIIEVNKRVLSLILPFF